METLDAGLPFRGWYIDHYHWPRHPDDRDAPVARVTVRGHFQAAGLSDYGEHLELDVWVPIGLTDRAAIEPAVWARVRDQLDRYRSQLPTS